MITVTDARVLLANPVQLLYELIPMPNAASVLVINSPDVSLFLPDKTRFSNVRHVILEFSGSPQQMSECGVNLNCLRGEKFDLVILHESLDEMPNQLSLPL